MPNIGPMELDRHPRHRADRARPEEAARGRALVGKGMREFKESLSGDNDATDDDEPTATRTEQLRRHASVGRRCGSPRSCSTAVVDHALRDAPNECCGFVGVRDGAAVERRTRSRTSPRARSASRSTAA